MSRNNYGKIWCPVRVIQHGISSIFDPEGTGKRTRNHTTVIGQDDYPKKVGFTKRHTSFGTPEELFEWLKTVKPADRCLYEVVAFGDEMKLYFDIDFKYEGENTFDQSMILNLLETTMDILSELNAVVDYEDFNIYCSSRPGKESYHIVLNNFYFENMDCVRHVVDMINDACELELDMSPYGKTTQLFRLIDCCKKGQDNFKKPFEFNYDGVCIEADYDPINSLIRGKGGELVLVEVPIPVVGEKMTYTGSIDGMINVLKGIPASKRNDYKIWLSVGMALKNMFGDPALSVWDSWSSESDYYNASECASKWDGFKSEEDSGYGFGTLCFYSDVKPGEIELELTQDGMPVKKFNIAKIKDLAMKATDETAKHVVAGIRKYVKQYFYRNRMKGGYYLWKHGEFHFYDSSTIKEFMSGVNIKQESVKWSLRSEYDNLTDDYEEIFQPGYGNIITEPDQKYVNVSPKYRVMGGETSGNCDLILKHLKQVVCRSNDTYYNYLIQWLARTILPGEKNTTAAVIVGKMGTGKSIIGDLVQSILGRNLSTCISGRDDPIVGRFNSEFYRKKFVILEEVFPEAKTFNRYANAMKNLITSKQLRIKGENDKPFMTNSMLNFLILSNDHNPVKMESHDRRYFVLETSDEFISKSKDEKEAYYGPLINSIESMDDCQAFYNHIADVFDPEFNMRSIPETARKTENILESQPSPIQFLHECFASGTQFSDDLNVLFGQYKLYCEDGRYKMFTKASFSRCLANMNLKTQRVGGARKLMKDRKGVYDELVRNQVIDTDETAWEVNDTIEDDIHDSENHEDEDVG